MEPKDAAVKGADETTAPKLKYYIEGKNFIDFADRGAMDKLTEKQKAADVSRSMNIILSWPNWDIWPFKVAGPVVGLTAVIPGYILNKAFRQALLLGHYARFSSYFAIMGVPGAISSLAHNMAITTDILGQSTKCPVCLQVKSACLQLAAGLIYPTVLAPIANFPTAAGIKNLYFPKIHKQPMEVLKFSLDVFKSVKNPYLAAGALQIVVAMGMTYLEQKCYLDTLYPILLGETKLTKRKLPSSLDER